MNLDKISTQQLQEELDMRRLKEIGSKEMIEELWHRKSIVGIEVPKGEHVTYKVNGPAKIIILIEDLKPQPKVKVSDAAILTPDTELNFKSLVD